MSRSVRFKLRGDEEKLALDIAEQLGVPLDVLGYQLYKSGMRLLLQEVARRREETEGNTADDMAEVDDDLVHTEGDSGDADKESGSTGATPEVSVEPASHSVENV